MAKKWLSLAISGLILTLIYLNINSIDMIHALGHVRLHILLIAIISWCPIIILVALRFLLLLPFSYISIGQSIQLTLLASTLNLILPAKGGDIAKAFFVQRYENLPRDTVLAVVVIEKLWDLIGIIAFGSLSFILFNHMPGWILVVFSLSCLLVLTSILLLSSRRLTIRLYKLTRPFIPHFLHHTVRSLFQSFRLIQKVHSKTLISFMFKLILLTIFISGCHFVQMWLLLTSLGLYLPVFSTIARLPLAVLAGLIPITFSGAGTRDLALIALFSPLAPIEILSAWGILCTARYFIPAIAGIPFILKRPLGIRSESTVHDLR